MLYLHLVLRVVTKKFFLISLVYLSKSLEGGMFNSLTNSSFWLVSSKLNVISLKLITMK